MSAEAMTDDEDGDFQLPMLGLYADLEAGSGSVLLPDEFHQTESGLQRRILADWQRGLALLQERLQAGPAVAQAEAAPAATAAVPGSRPGSDAEPVLNG